MGKTRSAKLHDEIQKDLLDQLERNGTIGKFYENLVCDYMSLWTTKNLLISDIESRGVSIPSATGSKKNDSVCDLVRTNAQMLKILSELGIKPAQSNGGGIPEL